MRNSRLLLHATKLPLSSTVATISGCGERGAGVSSAIVVRLGAVWALNTRPLPLAMVRIRGCVGSIVCDIFLARCFPISDVQSVSF